MGSLPPCRPAAPTVAILLLLLFVFPLPAPLPPPPPLLSVTTETLFPYESLAEKQVDQSRQPTDY